MNTSVIEAIERQKTTNLYDASKSIPYDEIRELVRLATFSPVEIKVLPSDGRGMAKRLVVDLNAMFRQGGHQYALLTSSFHRRLDAILSSDQLLAYYF
jgi:hypothetical protein